MTGELIELSNERDLWLRLLLDSARDAYAAGYADGRAAERIEADRAWAERPAPVVRGGDALADLERRRWTVRGEPRTRAEYGDPHPDDYTGGPR